MKFSKLSYKKIVQHIFRPQRLKRFNRKKRIISVLLLGLIWSILLPSLVFLEFLILCEIPTLYTNLQHERDALWKEFWPYYLNITMAVGIVTNLTTGGTTFIEPVNLNYAKTSFLEKSLQVCDSSEKIDILILVKSALKNGKKRNIVRSTWATKQSLASSKAKIKYAFLIGNPFSLDLESKTSLDDEINHYRDFIIGDYEDSYKTLTFKTMSGLRWAEESCSRYEFVISLDDDVELNLDNLVKFLEDPYKYPNSENDHLDGSSETFSKLCRPQCIDFYSGYAMQKYFFPNRYPKEKNYLSKEEYSPHFFPPYITGVISILSKTSATKMHALAPFIPHLHIDDVFIGILARKLQIQPHDISHLITTAYNRKRILFDYWKPSGIAIGRIQQHFTCD